MRKTRTLTIPHTWVVALFLWSCASAPLPPVASDTPEHNGAREATPAPPGGDEADEGPPDDIALGAACKRITEDVCRAGPPKQATEKPDPRHSLSTDGADIFYHGQETEFDAPSFRYATVQGCAPHGNVFAWDRNDVYHLSPQSCGGANCGGNYTGYGWAPMGVEDPSSFRWLAGGYATDGVAIYNQWHSGPLATESLSRFEVFLCGEYGTPYAYDGVNWFEGGQRLTREEAYSRLRKPH